MLIYVVRVDGCDCYNDLAAFTDLEVAKDWARGCGMGMNELYISPLAFNPKGTTDAEGNKVFVPHINPMFEPVLWKGFDD